jgi:hypothetical protein
MSLNFTHIKGDTFDEVAFELKINNVAVNLTGAVIKIIVGVLNTGNHADFYIYISRQS